jgi:hypothetical protein
MSAAAQRESGYSDIRAQALYPWTQRLGGDRPFHSQFR